MALNNFVFENEVRVNQKKIEKKIYQFEYLQKRIVKTKFFLVFYKFLYDSYFIYIFF